MSSGFFFWLCYVKLLVCEPDTNSCRWNLVYCSLPAKVCSDLLGFQNENLKIIAIFKFHPMNHCAIAEIDEPEELKDSIKVLMVGDNLLNFTVAARMLMLKSNLVAYYGFDVETAMQIAANKQVNIIIIDKMYSGKYNDRRVEGMEIVQMLKSNPENAQIPVILKLCGQVMVGDRDRYLAESGADDAIRLDPASWDFLIEKIKYNLSVKDCSQNTTINLDNRFNSSQPVKIQKESVLEFLAFKIYQLIMISGQVIFLIFAFLQRYKKIFRN
ncbi:hypothetical protein QUB70_07145 [Microcoleus sp. A003_D6]|uniref:hypothetical protein n=1 Tax=Microcoleus sp. A003_D6 TaxID=3055266 RepID=UPI002FCEECF6